jgi:hypothetical protein
MPSSGKLNMNAVDQEIQAAFEDGRIDLDLTGREAVRLPAEIGRLTKLESLDLSGNRLTELPPEIGELTNLQELRLQYNQLTALPAAISKLANLTILDVEHNRLTALPYQIGLLKNLRELRLSNNQLTSLPTTIGQLSRLQRLWIAQNRLQELPPQLGLLTGLRDWDFQAKKSLPPRFPLALMIDGNPLADPPPDVRGAQNICAYLRRKLDAGAAAGTVYLPSYDLYREVIEYHIPGGTYTVLDRDAFVKRGLPFSFGNFVREDENVAGVFASPEGPVFFMNERHFVGRYGYTRAKIDEIVTPPWKAKLKKFQLIHSEGVHTIQFDLMYKARLGLGVNPYDQTEEDIDLFERMARQVRDEAFFRHYTRRVE